MIAIKRVYETPHVSDGYRVLIDRIWPRGLTKEAARIDEWLKDAAPSAELRRWFDHREDLWREFQIRYRAELASPAAAETLAKLRKLGRGRTVTLVYAAKNETVNNARALQSILTERD
jgi:uncharacterized protein YeaO (DUF488 family)